ncbi:unnamed protein product, partial [marine sediment metagenome]
PQSEKCGILENITNIENDIANFTANASELA